MSAVDTRNQYAKQDPTKQYPQPKFEEQTQSAPGLVQVFDRVVTKMPDASVARRRKALLGIDAEIPDREDPLHWLLLQQS
jgi:hypothetical protein